MFHALFVALNATADRTLSATAGQTGHVGHQHALMLITVEGASADAGMLGAHVITAVLTIAMLWRGESMLRAIAYWVRERLRERMPATPAERSRMIRALIAALATGFVLVPAAAQAHIGVTPDSVTAEGSAVLTFSFTHGCEDSEQRCETGANEWVEIAEDGQDPHDLESLAPVVTVSDTAVEAAHDQHTTSDTAPADAASDGTAGSGAAPAIGIALGGAALLAGIAALFVAIRASRR